MSSKPSRTPSRKDADIVIVGGGIYGVMLALEAGRAGLRARVLERATVGGATSANWFRILHGGFRYLQSLDVVRTRESSAERRWFLEFAPDLVQPFSFMLPLYGGGLKRPFFLRMAFLLERILTPGRNRGLSPGARLAPGRTLTAAQTAEIYPDVRREGLLGAAVWQDAVALDDEALMARLRAAAEDLGAVFEEQTPALDLQVTDGRVEGVMAGGAEPGLRRAPVVINAAGPWSDGIAERFGSPASELFSPTLAFNLLIDRPPLARTGLAVAGPAPDAPMLFLIPLGQQTLAGTWHVEWNAEDREARVADTDVDAFLAALANATPTLGATKNDVLEILPGLQPLAHGSTTTVSDRPLTIDHADRGGPKGFFSVSGVKYTTARLVAENLLREIGEKGFLAGDRGRG
ncbi:MAG: FAD-dependent oxidoreductase [Geminicoccaceae bacterium]